MKYAYIIFEEITGEHMGVCTSMEDAIMYTQKLQKQSGMRNSKFPEERYVWTQLPLIEHKDLPSFTGNIGFKRMGSYNPLSGWDLIPVGLVDNNSSALLIDYTDKIPDVQFEIGAFGNIRFTVTSSAYIPEDEVLEYVQKKYEEWVK